MILAVFDDFLRFFPPSLVNLCKLVFHGVCGKVESQGL